MNIHPERVAWLAGFLTTIAFLPQVLKLFEKNVNVEGISLVTYYVFLCGVLFWIYYGWKSPSNGIFFTNGITALLSSIIIIRVYVLRHKKRRSH